MKKTVKCYQCKESVIKDEAKLVIHTTEKNQYKRYFHEDCYGQYELIMEEKVKWDNLYEYVRSEIMQYTQEQSLDKHFVTRLQGLRSGEYGVKHNKKVFLSKTGYPYDIILTTFKLKKQEIRSAIADKSKFTDEKHRYNFIMVIIQNSINDVYIRIKQKKQSDEKLKGKDFSEYAMPVDNEYKNKTNIKENKVAGMLDGLW
jgi:predicted transport protein